MIQVVDCGNQWAMVCTCKVAMWIEEGLKWYTEHGFHVLMGMMGK
jgi:hypothetical protein